MRQCQGFSTCLQKLPYAKHGVGIQTEAVDTWVEIGLQEDKVGRV